MPADTQYVLRAALDRQLGPTQGGTFGIVNQDKTAEIWVTVETFGQGPQGEVFYLRKQGETLTLSRGTLRAVKIEAKAPTTGADQYPSTIMLVDTDLVVSVTSLASAVAGGVTGTAADLLGWTNVKAYGALGDGVTDDTTAIGKAIAALPAGGGVLYFPPGTYLTSGGFTLSVPTKVIGGGGLRNAPVTTIECNSRTAVLFTVSANGCEFWNVGMVNTASLAPTAGAAIATTTGAGQRCQYVSCLISGFYVGANISYGGEWRMAGCYIYNTVSDGLLIANIDAVDGGDQAISDTWITGGPLTTAASAVAIHYLSGGGLKLTNVKINVAPGGNRYNDGIVLDLATAVVTSVLLIANCSIENLTHHGIVCVTNDATGQFNSILVTGCEIHCNTSGAGSFGIYVNPNTVNKITQVIVNGCVVKTVASAEPAIVVQNSDHVRVTGCLTVGFTGATDFTGSTDAVATATL